MKVVGSALAGLIGTFVIMLGLASLLDKIQGDAGLGAIVFYASFVASPIAAIAAGMWAASHNEPPADGSAK